MGFNLGFMIPAVVLITVDVEGLTDIDGNVVRDIDGNAITDIDD